MIKARRQWGPTFWNVLTYILVILFIFPVIWTVLTGFKTEAAAYAPNPTLFFQPTLTEFATAFNSSFGAYLFNSLVASLVSTAIAMVLGVPAAYSMVFQMRAKASNNMLFFVLSTRFIPFAAIIVPLYLILARLQLLDNLLGLILVYTAMNLPLIIWMAHSYFMDLPVEVMESSQIDGCTTLQALLRIVVPMAAPGLVAAALLAVIFAWNDFFFAISLTYTNAPTLPLMVSAFMTNENLFLAKISALATLIIIVPVVLGIYAQKHLVRGLTAGAYR